MGAGEQLAMDMAEQLAMDMAFGGGRQSFLVSKGGESRIAFR